MRVDRTSARRMLGFDEPLFRDRHDAGLRLGDALRDEQADIVIGLARGGVEVAAEVARLLGRPLEVVAVRKVGHPLQPEYAIGAAAPGDGTYVRASDGLTAGELAQAVAEARRSAKLLERRLRPGRPRLDLEGRTVILVDDGLATGATMMAAARWARGRGAERVIAAVPVAALESLDLLRPEVDELVSLYELQDFGAVGLWYETFSPVGDEEVLRLLDEAATRAPPGAHPVPA